jgi:hypothetical protein
MTVRFLKKLQFPFVVAMLVWMAACDDEFTEIGSDIVSGVNFDVNNFMDADVKAYNVRLNPIQSNNLPSQLLGVLHDPVYGDLVANVATEVFLTQLNPIFGENATVDSVLLTVPYFSTQTEILVQTGQQVFRLDSIFGEDPFKLSIYENKFFLNSLDPENDFQSTIPLFSNRHESFISQVGPLLFQNEAFKPSPETIVVFPETGDPARDTIPEQFIRPQLRVALDEDFFQQKIVDKEGDIVLTNINQFQNFFRGLYFVAEPINPTDKGMVLMDFSQGNIEIRFSFDTPDTGDADEDGDVTEIIRSKQSINISLTGAKASAYIQNFDATIAQQIAQADSVNGDERLYLKGGEGSMAVIDLFGPDTDGDGEADQLTLLKQTDRLINDARLVFQIDKDAVQNSIEPTRIYLYDLKNNIPIIDFDRDGIIVSQNIFRTKTTYDGLIRKDENGRGTTYRVRLTDHIKNILRNDSLNVPLGLVVTNNVSTIGNSNVSNPSNSKVTQIPRFSVIEPLGTVLYGSNLPPSEAAKKIRLEIIFTEPSN